MKIRTAKGKEFECDLAVENNNPERLYIHLTDKTLMDVLPVFSKRGELPFVGYPDYTQIDSIYAAPSGTNLTLKK